MADLITSGQVLAQLTSLTTAQIASLGATITAASDAVESYCGRIFSLQTFVETITDQANGGTVKLRRFPVSRVQRCSTNPTNALSIQQTDTNTNQRATAELTTTGDWTGGLTLTGLTVSRTASAVVATNTLAISSTTTLAALTASINALGSGWVATVPTPFNLWAATELIPPQGTLSVFGLPATFAVYGTDLNFSITDPDAGFLAVASGQSSRIGGIGNLAFSNGVGYGGSWVQAGSVGYPGTPGGPGNPIRVTYNAGYATIPAVVQQATIATVQAILDDVLYSQVLSKLSLGVASYELNRAKEFIPQSAKMMLAKYISYEIH